MDLKRITFVDTETTGGNATYDRIIEIGIVVVENNHITQTFKSLVNPGMSIPEYISGITGISNEDISNAPSFGQIKDEVYGLLEGSVFVAHNVAFDYGFIKNEFRREGINFTSKYFCTVKLSRKLFPEYTHHNLDSIIERFGFEAENRHRAYDDAYVLWQFYSHVNNIFPEETIQKALKELLAKPNLPTNIPAVSIEMLPESHGVYLMYDANGMPLYIGKSKNIKRRVLSHFTNTKNSKKELAIFQQVASIDHKPTYGELGALILESDLVKSMKPVYNAKLRKHDGGYLIIKEDSPEGYYKASIIKNDTEIDPSIILAKTKSRRKAKEMLASMAKAYGLCNKLLGLQKSGTACFLYDIKICKGACKGTENPKSYNNRFMDAFSTTGVDEWPFEGAILIEERDPFIQKGETYIFKNWIYCGVVKWDSEDSFVQRNEDQRFDPDMYHIIKDYLRKNFWKVKLITDSEYDALMGIRI